MRAAVSRAGSTVIITNRSRSAMGWSASSWLVRSSSFSVVGQTSGQLVKPKNSTVQRPCRSSAVNGSL